MGDVRRAEIRDTPLSVDEALTDVAADDAGGVALFVGVVRDHDDSRGVTGLAYSAHPSAAPRLADVAASVAELPGVVAVSAMHRVGELRVGDLAVVVAAAAAHREDAFAACRRLIDDVKAQVPIWKHQRFDDGTHEWVGSPSA